MRTTLTIEDDVAYGLRRVQESEPRKPFKRLINELLRKGLESKTGNPEKKRFHVKAHPIGLRTDLNFDNIEEVLDILDGVHRK